jgi:hypothetical protein
MDKIQAENLTRRGAGRPKGSINKTTAAAKSMIEQAAQELGGVNRLVEWAKEAPENERAFWATVFPKLLPLQVHGAGENGEHTVVNKVLWEVVGSSTQDT